MSLSGVCCWMNSRTKGKKSALRSCIEHNGLGKSLIACVDSDYDWLLQGVTQTSREIISNPYVIQTYAYAIENYQCWAGSLHQICVQCTLIRYAGWRTTIPRLSPRWKPCVRNSHQWA